MKGLTQGLLYGIIWAMILVFTAGLGLLVLGPVLFLTFAGAEQRAAKAYACLRTTLMRDEELLAEALQHRIFALWHRRALVAVTSSRVLLIQRGLLGGFKMQDIQWKDLVDATIEQNVLPDLCGSNLSFKNSNRQVGLMSIEGVEAQMAADIYAQAQAEEQAWEEKRRVRAMEETRAAAGGVVVHAAPQASSPMPAASGANRMLQEVEKAKSLLDIGAISDVEYNEMKAKILAAV